MSKTSDKFAKISTTAPKKGGKDSFTRTSQTPEEENTQLKQKNRLLQRALDQLVDNANTNQATQDKFYQLELYFLQAKSFDELIKRILIDMKSQFNVGEIQLFLYDPEHEIRQLLTEIYGEIDYPGLFFCDDIESINKHYAEQEMVEYAARLMQLPQGMLGKLNDKINFYSAAYLPLLRNQQLIGSLHLLSSDKGRFSPQLATHFIEHMASIVSVCIDNTLNQERYKHLSLVDMLTRVKNRRYFFQALSKEIARTLRARQTLSCLFLDIDFFKKINDEHGHAVGDKALKHFAKLIQPMLRQSDILARFGGEEFTVLLPNTSADHAFEIAKRICQKVRESSLTISNDLELKMTASIGVSSYHPTQEELTIEDIQHRLINQADEAVYMAKESGRDCVKVSTQ